MKHEAAFPSPASRASDPAEHTLRELAPASSDASPTAVALDRLLRAAGNPLAVLRSVGPAHPEFVRAQLIRAATGVIAKVPAAFPIVAKAIAAVRGLPLSARSRLHLEAAEAWLSGFPARAADTYATIVECSPHDLLALRLAQSCHFFLGRHDELCALVDRAAGAWDSHRPGFEFVLALASFVHAENGDTAYAERLGRQALANDDACPFGVHALAHAFAESGRHAEGARWMRDQRAQWVRESRMRTHNAWHLAMFDAEEGNVESALSILDEWLLPASGESLLDACDATALLWRLTPFGIDGEERWTSISNAFDAASSPGFWPYIDIHAGLAHQCAGEKRRFQALARGIDGVAQGSAHGSLRARLVTRPALRALEAWGDGRHAEAADLLAALDPVLGDAGGSRVQLEILHSVKQEARRRQALPQPGTAGRPATCQSLPGAARPASDKAGEGDRLTF
jgi:hypothetical protein